MLFAILFLASGILMFYSLLTALYGPYLTFLERLATALCAGPVLGGWIILFLAGFNNGITFTQIFFVTLIFFAIAWWVLPNLLESLQTGREEIVAMQRPLFVVGLVILIVQYIMNTHLIPEGKNGELMTAGNVYGDLPFHLTVINSFLYGKNSRLSPLDTPGTLLWIFNEAIFDGHRLVYPLIPDFLTAVCVVSGTDIRTALLLPSWTMAAAFFIILFCAANRWNNNNHTASVVCVLLVFCCGGNYEFSAPPFWLFFIQDIFLPQRSAMFAYTLSLSSFIALWVGLTIDRPAPLSLPLVDNDDPSGKSKKSSVASVTGHTPRALRHQLYELSGFLCGLLPFLQGHAFISVFMVSGVTLLIEHSLELSIGGTVSHFVQGGAYFAGPAILFGMPQMISFMDVASSAGFMTLQPMWYDFAGNSEGMFSWFWTALGLFLPCSILALQCMNKVNMRRYVGFFFLFVVCCFYKFQPWKVDNMKLFYIWYFVAAMAVGDWLVWVYKKPSISLISVLLFVHFIIPGGHNILTKECSDHYTLFSPREIELGEWAKSHTPSDAVFLIDPRHNHPVPAWAGRAVWMGYAGWLSSRSYPFSERDKIARKIYQGEDNPIALCQNNEIDYVVVSHRMDKIQGVKVNTDYLSQAMRQVFKNELYTVYELPEKGKKFPRKVFGPLIQKPKAG
eukprot:TRINITY_DN12916_c0_g1_i1.p1 TRINITY_DN12916_c0_g1~~TRINITY_DN12916_c0_g1_i1.p1  ORF type:complete len:689 (-),score=173.62 TRINITY_DN12916_c0_g1_i1:71-2098(-)